MAEIIVLKHVRLTRTFQAVEQAAFSLDGELRALQAIGRGAVMRDFAEEVHMLRTYVRTLHVLLKSMDPDEIGDAGLGDRHAVAQAAVGRCSDALRAMDDGRMPAIPATGFA